MLGYPAVQIEEELSEAFYDFAHPEVLVMFGGDWNRTTLQALVYRKAQQFCDLDASRIGCVKVLAGDFMHRL